MNNLIAFCGLDCAECGAYKATQADDLEAKQKVIEKWRVEFNSPEMDISAATCDGCRAGKRSGGYCMACPVRACGLERGVANCAVCPDYGCATLEGFLSMAPPLRARLEALRQNIA